MTLDEYIKTLEKYKEKHGKKKLVLSSYSDTGGYELHILGYYGNFDNIFVINLERKEQ